MPNATDFNAISIALASSEHVKQWSHGEVVKPETINYRTLRPEKDGLFCERIFGPTKDWECHCGKYKKQRFRGVICDRCGVEVTRANVRRQRMGHVSLAAPVAHIWFAKGIPSRLGLLLDVSPRNLERVLYFAQYIVTKVDPLLQKRKTEEMEVDCEERVEALQTQITERVAALEAERERLPDDDPKRGDIEVQLQALKDSLEEQRETIRKAFERERGDVESLKPLMLLTESRHRDLADKYGDVFRAGIGAEAILELLRSVDMTEEIARLKQEVRTTSGQRRKRAIKRVEVLEAFQRSGNKPEWMVMTALPVLPPDLRPMVQLDGGRFATSDLNDLYRRVINRNNRLKRLLELGAPEIIIRNEKRMLQEAVDDLIDNGRRGRAIVGSHNHQLKSLSDLLRGKQGRFRQNLLGKRVDYGGRSVIVVGPDLKLHECGLPKKMALELFKPFVMSRLWSQGMANNAKSAKRMVDRAGPEVWDILEEVIQDRPVLLNRAPTLHRLGIQAFMPRLIEGSAIQLHPLVCAAFNADFDGDQMAVHVPLSREAMSEARNVMLSKYNMLSPSSGQPLVAPTYEIVLGCYYLTQARPGAKGEDGCYRDFDDVMVAFDAGALDLRAEVWVPFKGTVVTDAITPFGRPVYKPAFPPGDPVHDKAAPSSIRGDVKDAIREVESDGWMLTTPGRIIFNSLLPEAIRVGQSRFYDRVMDKKALLDLVKEVHDATDNDTAADVLDSLKNLGFQYATRSGITVGITDIKVPPEKAGIIANAEDVVRGLEGDYEMGLLSDQERHARIISAWQEANGKMDAAVKERLRDFGGIYDMAHSGARGNEAQIKQMAAWRGLMSKPGKSGLDVIEQPVKSSFREGLNVLEYFISTHGARKGLTDTALRTADSGYLTRRLVDVAQEAIIKGEDCGTEHGVNVYAKASDDAEVMLAPFAERIAGRVAAADIADPDTGEVIVDAGAMIEKADAQRIQEIAKADAQRSQDAGAEKEDYHVYVRSPITCAADIGVCKQCYGWSPATGKLVRIGDAVGIVAAQSIGEPGTQLTMRTFHMGGVAGLDITTGLPRVEEIFEARVPKGKARIAEIGKNPYLDPDADPDPYPYDGDVLVFENGQLVGEHDAPPDAPHIVTPPVSFAPVVRVVNRIPFVDDDYEIGDGLKLAVKDGQEIKAGQPIAEPAPKPKRSRAKKAEEPAADESAVPVAQTEEPAAVLARVTGTVEIGKDGEVKIRAYHTESHDHPVDATAQRLVQTTDHTKKWSEVEKQKVKVGQPLTSGVKDPHDILRIQGKQDVVRYFVDQVQVVYRNQGVDINDKHIETILAQMLRWFTIETIGDTNFLPNQTVDMKTYDREDKRVQAEGGDRPTGKPAIRGVTRASLNTESFLAKASFQETTRVLTEAAMSGDVDHLRGLKENVIIGRHIPARLDLSEEGRDLLGIPERLPSRAGADDELDAIRSLISGAPGMPFDDEDDDDDFIPSRRPASIIDFSIDDDDDDDDFLADDDDDDLLADPEDPVADGESGGQSASASADADEPEDDSPDPDDLPDPFEGRIAPGPDPLDDAEEEA